MKRILMIITSLLFIICLISCNEEDNLKDDNINIGTDAIEINETNITLYEGESYTLNLDVDVLLTSSNNSAILVNEKTITAIKEGTSIITIKLVSDMRVSKEISVTVLKKVNVLEGIETNITIEENEEYILDIDGITLQSSDQTIVSVNGKTIKGIKEGETIVKVSDASGNFKDVIVTVKFPTFSFFELLDFDYYYRYYNKKEYDSIIEELIKYKFDSDFKKKIHSIIVIPQYEEHYLMRKSIRETFVDYFSDIAFEYVKEGTDYKYNKKQIMSFSISTLGDDNIIHGCPWFYVLYDGTVYVYLSFKDKGKGSYAFVGKLDEEHSADELVTYVKENRDYISLNIRLKVGESDTISEGLDIKITAEDESLLEIEGNTITALKEGKTKIIVEYVGEDFKQENYVYIESVDEGE